MKLLFVIPARGGSKGIPGKNIKQLAGKPLIHYSIEYARLYAPDEDICLTTDDALIAETALDINYRIPFFRPSTLATDYAGTYEVIKHAYTYYISQGKVYDVVVLLQPTSPIRDSSHLKEALSHFDMSIDMVVSVNESVFNPYYNLFEENSNGLLTISKGNGNIIRRQDAPPVFAYNGSIYIINTDSLNRNDSFSSFTSIKKYIMDDKYDIDLDTPKDWDYAEYLLKSKNERSKNE